MWTPSEAVRKAQSPLERGDVVGHVQQDRAGLGFGTSWAMWHKSISHAGPVNQLGKTEKSQAQLEGSLENGRKQRHLQYPPYSPKRPLVKWRRPYVCSLPNSSNSQAKKACPKATTPRNVQLPQPGPATTGDYLIRKENWRQCPCSYSGLNTKPNILELMVLWESGVEEPYERESLS